MFLKKENVGRKVWAVPDCHIPLRTTGREPELTSRDQLALLNTYSSEASVELTIFYEESDSVGPYRFEVPGRRIRKVRLNDLIDPHAIELDRPFSCLIESDTPLVVQFSRLDSGCRDREIMGTLAYSQ